MKTVHLGTLEVSRIGLGAMTMAGTYTSEGALDNAESIRTIHRAFDLGVTHIDTAEIYGRGESERIVGRFLAGRNCGRITDVDAAQERLLHLAKAMNCFTDYCRSCSRGSSISQPPRSDL